MPFENKTVNLYNMLGLVLRSSCEGDLRAKPKNLQKNQKSRTWFLFRYSCGDM